MNKNEIMNALTAKGITFDASASKAELEALLNANASVSAVSADLIKQITENGGFAFDSAELQAQLKADKEREYPDFGRDIPEGNYIVTGYATSHDWKNRTGNVTHIRTAYIKAVDSDEIYEAPFAAFGQREWDFVKVSSDSEEKFKPATLLGFIPSTADRNLAVCKVPAGTKVTINHCWGHWNNPNNTRIFNFKYTWISAAK